MQSDVNLIMAILSPSSTEHLEFSNNSQTVSVINTESDQYSITNVTYKHENNVKFNDLNPTWSSLSFSYRSTFDNAVDRRVYYVIESKDHSELEKYYVNNFYDLPNDYDAVYKVDNPQESTKVVFTVSLNHRYKITSTDSVTGETIERWSDWTPTSPASFVATIETNLQKHMELVRYYVTKGKYAQQSSAKPF